MTEPVALITGAGRRLGAAIAEALHNSGYRVVLHYRQSRQQAEALADRFNQSRSNSATSVQADLLRQDERQQLASAACDQWQRLDLLVNSASSFYPTPLGSATDAQWDDIMGSNLKAPFFLCQALAGALTERRGCIINIADIYGDRPLQNHSIYSIAKAGNCMLTKSLAQELAPDIRVNGIAPGAILWPENAQPNQQDKNDFVDHIPLQRLGGTESIAQAVLYLAQPDNYVSGHILTVDGGRSLRQ